MHVLLDEQSEPGLRSVIGSLLAASDAAHIAVSRVRLGVVDLGASEMAGVRECRILLGRLDVEELTAIAQPHRSRSGHMDELEQFLSSPRVAVRSAGMGGWLPDFSIYDGVPLGQRGTGSVCLMGAHWFREPPIAAGPSFSCLLTDSRAVARARRRFDALWDEAHDVRAAVLAAVVAYGKRVA
jgi:hypothetical protein